MGTKFVIKDAEITKRHSLMANFSTEGWSGPASLRYQTKKQQLLDFRRDEDNPNVKQCIDEYVASLDRQIERAFNVREGFARKDDTLPSRFLIEPLAKAGPATGQVVCKLDLLLDEYYNAMGYTRQGIPSTEKLRQIDLE